MILIDMDRLRKELMAKGDIPIHEVFNTIWEQPIVNISQSKTAQWIPVSERLPEDDGYYFVTEKDGRIGIYVFHKQGNSEEYWKRCVIAWMPLPPSYQGE